MANVGGRKSGSIAFRLRRPTPMAPQTDFQDTTTVVSDGASGPITPTTPETAAAVRNQSPLSQLLLIPV